jgi:nucleotide-binding universal stress UspA family protein
VEGGERVFKKMLVPLDGSEMAEAVVPYVEDMAKCYGAQVILLQVIPTPQDRATGSIFQPPLAVPGSADDVVVSAHPLYRDQEIQSARSEVERALSGVRQGLDKAGVDTRVAVQFGRPADKIVEYAEKEEVDLIVMSTYGSTGLGRWAFGSVTKRVMRATGIPVLLIRPGSRGP